MDWVINPRNVCPNNRAPCITLSLHFSFYVFFFTSNFLFHRSYTVFFLHFINFCIFLNSLFLAFSTFFFFVFLSLVLYTAVFNVYSCIAIIINYTIARIKHTSIVVLLIILYFLNRIKNPALYVSYIVYKKFLF